MESDVERSVAFLAAQLRDARKQAGLTQDDLAQFSDADRFAIAALERGEATTQLRRLVAAFDALGLELVAIPRTNRLATTAPAGGDDHGERA